MPHIDTVIRSRRVVTPEGVAPAAVAVRAGRITTVTAYDRPLPARTQVDLGEVALLPGAIDLDAAVQAPGRTLREGYTETSAAAARAGVTTVVAAAAPASPPVTDVAALTVHLAAAAESAVNVAFLGGITASSTPADLADLRAAGVVAFHCSLSDGAGAGTRPLDDHRLRKAMVELAAMEVPLLVHAEDAAELAPPAGPGNVALLAARPPRAERRGLERVISAARMAGTRAHISPFTAAECAAVLAGARAIGVAVSAQTCPHYLCLPAEQVPDDSASHACHPPLRAGTNREALWRVLLERGDCAITSVGSGHRPGTGVSGISWTLPALWTAARRRGCDLADIARWTATAAADLVGMRHRGRLAPDCDADLVAFDPDARQAVPPGDPGPYAGRTLTGRVERTWVAGRPVYVRAGAAGGRRPAAEDSPVAAP
ncbi:amidohydrolase family protein [Streptomonospora nanhaiensis]|uniref:amidohydrolase family protein n=1 Tax=Streptomonospora nanhaiensis TaxID=1323731 RepID=UPI001C99B122|nr:amidohydrolase family protein [Streptomonospora nanhaiensis]MBX9388198.1 amidohydrolase family protein [Streptomonospora nanhaiensis]